MSLKIEDRCVHWRGGYVAAVALIAAWSIATASSAIADDVVISTDTTTGVDLDTYVGTTAEVGPGVSVSNAAFSNAVKASAGAWTLTNNGSITSSLANTISLGVNGSSVVNFGSIAAGSNSNAISLTGGGSVDNKASGTISAPQSAIIIGTTSSGGSGPGTVTNAGTITQTGTFGDLVILSYGGIVTNLQGATISANNTSNAVSVGQGTSRTVINSGTITNTGASFATGVLVQGGASAITNTATGAISGTFNGIYASASAPLTFNNAGLIESTGASASARAVEATGGGTFINTGTVRSASSDGLYLARAGTVTNSGTIKGAVNAINFSGNYARTLILDTGSVLTGLVQGGTGTDDLVLQGSGSEDISKFRAFETLALQGTAWTLANAGTFSTSSAVQSGTLTVNGTLTSPTMSVSSGGTLTGSGSVAAATSIADGGTLAGQAGQTLTLNSLGLSSGSTVQVALGAPSTTRLFNVLGDLTLDGSLNISDAGGLGNGVYRLFDYGGTLNDLGLNIGTTASGTSAPDFTVQTSVANQVNLLVEIDPGTVQFWNGTTTIATGQIEGGNGTWTAGPTTNWTNAAGARADRWKGNFAVFFGSRTGSGMPASGSVTVDDSQGAVSTNGMQFIGKDWTVTGDAVTLAGAGGITTIRVGDGSPDGASDSATIASRLTGATQLVKDDLGTLTLTGSNDYSGGTSINAGTLRLGNGSAGGSILGNVAINGTFVIDRSDDLSFNSVLSGTGTFDKLDANRLTLTANSGGFAGTTTIQGGILSLAGTLGGTLALQSGTRLEGSGTAGAVAVSSGATVAPGNSIGTLSVGSISFAPGSIYEIEVDETGQNDRINATGAATINGGTVSVLAQNGTYAASTQYTILSASGGVSGPGFDSVTSDLAFLTPSLQQTADSVILILTRNTIDFGEIGGTFNQRSAGYGLETLGAGPAYDAVLNLTDAGARAAFDAISGEIHSSLRTALLEDSRLPREAVLHRLQEARDTATHIWSEGFGSWGHNGTDGNAARLDRNTAGFLAGFDTPLGGTWRGGLAAGYTHQELDVVARASKAGITEAHLLGYAGGDYGPVRISLGAGYAAANTQTARSAAFPGFAELLTANYSGSVVQGFGEAGYPLALGNGELEPFWQIAAVEVNTDRFFETGGTVALAGHDNSQARAISTLGVRGSWLLSQNVSADASAGWRRMFGDQSFLSTMRFAGSNGFEIAGVPYARDVAAVDAGATMHATGNISLWARYSGVIGGNASDHAVRGGVSLGL